MLVNGQPADSLPLTDRGLSYGDGVFETIAVRNGEPEYLDRHLLRLNNGCVRLGIKPPSAEKILTEALQLSRALDRAVLKIIITRGQGGRGYRPDADGETTRILLNYPWPDYPKTYASEGIAATVCKLRLGRNAQLAGIKHLNRLEQVLARGEWQDEYQEGIVLDTEGHVVEGTMSNLFIVRGIRLLTPALAQCGVAGIMRDVVLETAQRQGIEVLTTDDIHLQDLQTADALFFCNSLIRLWPTKTLDAISYSKNEIIQELMSYININNHI